MKVDHKLAQEYAQHIIDSVLPLNAFDNVDFDSKLTIIDRFQNRKNLAAAYLQLREMMKK